MKFYFNIAWPGNRHWDVYKKDLAPDGFFVFDRFTLANARNSKECLLIRIWRFELVIEDIGLAKR